MRYIADHDFHIHSTISPCCHDEEQTPENILRFAEENGYRRIALTNHLWDEAVHSEASWHEMQRFSALQSALPLPQGKNTQFFFSAEVDMDYDFNIGVSEEHYDSFDFLVISTTHLHLAGNTVRKKLETPDEAAEIWVARMEALLKKELPWYRVGIAHMTSGHIMKERTPEVIDLITDKKLYDIFTDCASKGLGIELNTKTIFSSDEEKQRLLRPYYIAKDCGCKFYLGSDSHKLSALPVGKENFERIITHLDLSEDDKFTF